MFIKISFFEDIFPFLIIFSPIIIIYIFYLYYCFRFKQYGYYFFEEAMNYFYRENQLYYKSHCVKNNSDDVNNS